MPDAPDAPDTLPAQAEELYWRVLAATEGTPYAVARTERGFTLSLDVVDEQWFGVLHQAGVSVVVRHEVQMPEAGIYTITDESRELTWAAGVPTLVGGRWMRGRVIRRGFRRVYGFDEHGRFGAQADYRYDTEEGRAIITAVARQLHLRARRGLEERIGLYVGLFAAVGALITAVVLVVLALGGYFNGV